MKYGVSTLSIIPIRIEPSEKSELISQLLFGELVYIDEEYSGWVKINTDFDKYEGWIDKKMLTILEEEEFKILFEEKPLINQESIQVYDNKEFIYPFNISPGSSIYLSNKLINLQKKQFYLKNIFPQNENDSTDITKVALSYLNTPYLWGGRTPYGIDCSGFTQIVYKIAGINIPRDSGKQIEFGSIVDFIGNSKPGDLAFFDNEEGEIVHVGIIIENNRIIHASGKVRIDHLDHQGIYNPEMREYSHKLRIIKKLID